jgi:hypothetical protein
MIELNWADYEPQQGVFNVNYERDLQQRVQRLRDAGTRVTLGLGLHYTPEWVSHLPNAHFVDQNGDVSQEIDFTFNSVIRAAADVFLARANDALDFSNFWAIRITSGGRSELVYPSGGTYWAFGRNAQNGPQYPSGLAPNPYPGWRPGDSSLSTSQTRHWLMWYLGALANTAEWQMDTVRSFGFTGYLQTVTPGVGILPDALNQVIATGLPNSLAGNGAVWDQIYALLAREPNVMAYVSSMADGSGGNEGCQQGDEQVPLTSTAIRSWSATRWISRIARQHNLPIAGENPGYQTNGNHQEFYRDSSTVGMLSVTFEQARSCQFLGVYWAHDQDLWDGTLSSDLLFAQAHGITAMPPLARPR